MLEKLLTALFINTFLKFFNSRLKSDKDKKEEADLHRIVKKQILKKITARHVNHTPSSHFTPSSNSSSFSIALGCRHLLSKLKALCLKLEHSERFENSIMIVIILNIVLMALDSPILDQKSALKKGIHDAEIVFTTIYGVEIIIKAIACGLFKRGGYFRDPKNLIDFLLFLLNIAGFLLTSSLGFLNALRAFHIVVLTKYFESLRIILISLYKSIPNLFKLLFFAFCFMLVFGTSKEYVCTLIFSLLVFHSQLCFH